MTAKQLREKKGSLIHQMEDVKKQADLEKRMMTDDEARQFDAWDNEMETVNAEIRRVEKLENEAVPAEGESRDQFDEKYSKAFMDMVRFGKRSDVLDREFRTTQSGVNTTAATGGYTIPQGFGGEIIKQMFTLSELLNYVTVKNTASGNAMPYPTSDDTSNKGHYLAEETQAAQTIPGYGVKTLNAFVLVSDIVPVSFQILEDSAFDFQAEVLSLCTDRIARGIDYALVLGGGTTDPNGIATAATTQGAYMAKAAMTRLTLLDLVHSIDIGYRKSPKCAFLMNDTTLKVLKKLTIGTADDRSMWQPSLIAGKPDTIEGFPYIINSNVASFGTAGYKPMFFGDFSQYYFRQVAGFHLQVFNERYADFLQRGFMLWTRNDGELMNTSAIKHAVCAAT